MSPEPQRSRGRVVTNILMHVMARALWAPKAGNRSDEYEDAFWPQRTINRTVNRSGSFRFAVADGATETSFAGLWARRLVRAYGSGCFAGRNWQNQLRREQAAWYAEVLQKPLPWYAEEKVHSGAFAALLGLELHNDRRLAEPGDRRLLRAAVAGGRAGCRLPGRGLGVLYLAAIPGAEQQHTQ